MVLACGLKYFKKSGAGLQFRVIKLTIRTTSPSASLLLTQYNLSDVNAPRPDVYATRTAAMASGKKSALLSSLADYGDDSEPDSEPEGEETGTRGHIQTSRCF